MAKRSDCCCIPIADGYYWATHRKYGWRAIVMVWPYTSHDRVELIHADAGEYLSKTDRTWDVAWHDIWTDTARGDPHLKVAHLQLMAACSEKVQRQGAWAFPRHMQRAVERIMTR